jgi:hypothetical protein
LVNQFNAVEYDYVVSGSETHRLTFFHGGDHENFEGGTRVYTAMVDLLIWANT